MLRTYHRGRGYKAEDRVTTKAQGTRPPPGALRLPTSPEYRGGKEHKDVVPVRLCLCTTILSLKIPSPIKNPREELAGIFLSMRFFSPSRLPNQPAVPTASKQQPTNSTYVVFDLTALVERVRR